MLGLILNSYTCIFSVWQVHKIIGFAPILLQVVMEENIDMPVRQAGKFLTTILLTQ